MEPCRGVVRGGGLFVGVLCLAAASAASAAEIKPPGKEIMDEWDARTQS